MADPQSSVCLVYQLSVKLVSAMATAVVHETGFIPGICNRNIYQLSHIHRQDGSLPAKYIPISWWECATLFPQFGVGFQKTEARFSPSITQVNLTFRISHIVPLWTLTPKVERLGCACRRGRKQYVDILVWPPTFHFLSQMNHLWPV